MLESTIEFLKCVRCGSKLEVDVFKHDLEIDEGILNCHKCPLSYPIIKKIPIMWDDFTKYLSVRKLLGGNLYQSPTSSKLKNF